MNDQNINQLIKTLAENSAKMEMLLARNPEKEFGQAEGNVGASDHFLPCQRHENYLNQTTDLDTLGRWVVVASLYPQFWDFSLIADNASGMWNGFDNVCRKVLRVEFSDTVQFNKVSTHYIQPQLVQMVTAFTADSGSIVYKFKERIPIRKRCARITMGTIARAGQVFGTLALSNYTPLSVSIFGE